MGGLPSKAESRAYVPGHLRQHVQIASTIIYAIPRSRHNPKILGVDDTEIVGDRITKACPIPWNCFTQEIERRIGELGASCVALIVRDMLVHHAP
jgi:hypothetical protein